MKPLVYIAGPYTHPDPVRNTRRAVAEGLRIRDEHDVAVLVPHLNLLADFLDPRPVGYWYDFDLDQLEHCDIVYRLHGPSTGADAEVAHANERRIPVVVTDAQLAEAITDWRDRR